MVVLIVGITCGAVSAAPWTKYSGNPVIGPYTGAPWVIYDNGTYRMWYMAGSIVDEDIYYSESTDGINWSSGQVALYLPGVELGASSVIKEGSVYKMWYVTNAGVFLTTSSDAQNFSGGQIVSGVTGILLAVLQNGPQFWGWESLNGEIYRAVSSDGLNWTEDSQPALQRGATGEWDADDVTPGCVVRAGNRWYMLYVGDSGFENDRIGLATSTDGLLWEKDPGNPIVGPGMPGSWDQHQVTGGSTVARGNRLEIWYTGNIGSGGNQNAIGHAWAYANENGTVRMMSGAVSGTPVQDGVLELTVMPGQFLDGSISVEADNYLDASAVVPLCMIWNWDTRETAHSVINGWIPPGVSTHEVALNLTAPTTPGTYYVTFAHSGEFSSSQVASLTNWAVGYDHWNDGADIADWDSVRYAETLLHGAAISPYEFTDGYHERWVPAGMIRVVVESGPPLVCEPDPEGQGLRCRGTITREMSPYIPELAINVRTGDTLRIEPGAVLLLAGGWLVARPGGTIIANQAQIVQQITGNCGPHCPCGINIESEGAAYFRHMRVSVATPCGFGNAAILNCTGQGGVGGVLSIHRSTVISGGSTIVNCGTLDSSAVELVAVHPMENGTVELVGGELNGTPVVNNVLEITIGAGHPITGTVTVEADNWLNGSAVVPLVAVWGWDENSTSYQTISNWIPTGLSTHDVALSLTAPEEPGTYYVTVAHSGEFTGDQVASLTNWSVGQPHWNDALDIADWGIDKYLFTLANHAALAQYEFPEGYTPWWVPAAMIKVEVIDCTPFPPLPPEIVVLPNGMDAEIHWSPAQTGHPACPAVVDAYLVWYSPQVEGPFYFHGYTSDTTYAHHGVIRFASNMFYQVEAYSGSMSAVLRIEVDTPRETAIALLGRNE
ncbi:hypothetical protein HZB60_00485 [candidate division KSB1 bacterium]|nr:hypothetical protein [candidate division KSB1 bacterium]